MASRTRRSAVAMAAAAQALVDAAADAPTEASPIDAEDPEILDGVLDGLRRLDQGGSNRITWYVYDDSMQDSGYIEKLRTEQLDEELFKTRYGAGAYRVIGKNASGQYVKGASAPVKISSVLAEPRRATSGATHAPDSDALALLREMRAADERRAQQRQEDNRNWAQALAGPLATVAAAWVSRPSTDIASLVVALRPQQSTLSEMTQALMNLQALQGEKSNTMDVMLKVLDRVQDMPASAGEGGWIGIVRDVLREAAPVAREMLSRPGQPQPQPVLTAGPAFGPGVRTLGAPSPVPAPANPAVSPVPVSPEADMWRIAEPWLKRRAEDLLEDAAANMDVDLVAEMLFEKARKRFEAMVSLSELLVFLQHPQWWELLIRFFPPITPYQAWVNDVRVALLRVIADELKETQGSEGTHAVRENGSA